MKDKEKTKEQELFELEQRLKAPFPFSVANVRVGMAKSGKGIPFFYIDVRDAVQRLSNVIGIGNYSISITNTESNVVEVMKKGEWDNTAKKYGPSVLVQELFTSVCVKIDIHHPLLNCSVSNIGEDKGEHAYTSAYAQALKRACSMIGIGEYLYHLKVGFKPLAEGSLNLFKEPKENLLPVETMNSALKTVGFKSICEVTGEKIPDWIIAAQSVHTLGKVLSVEGAKKV